MMKWKITLWCVVASLPLTAACLFARDRAADTSPVDQVDSARAFSYLMTQCDFGPRNPGSSGHAACLEYLVAELTALCDTVEVMHFQPVDSHGDRVPPLTNIVGRIVPGAERRYLFCAHWDTRPRADHDPDPARRDEPILGANDGASGVAVLLELARILNENPPPMGVDLVLFDGEDYGEEGRIQDYMLGSREYARQRWHEKPELGVLVDLVGDSDLELPIEQNSWAAAPDVVEKVWSAAEKLGERAFVRRTGYRIFDDHLPLIEVGWPVIDIIDFDYPYWHTHADTPEHCSPESLGSVARVLVELIYGS